MPLRAGIEGKRYQVTLVDANGTIVRQVYGERFTAEDLAEPLKLLIAG